MNDTDGQVHRAPSGRKSRGRSREGVKRQSSRIQRFLDVGLGALIVAILTLGRQIVDSATINRYWEQFKGVTTGQEPSPEIEGLPYSFNTASKPRGAVLIETDGHIDQSFTARTPRIDMIKVIVGRDDEDQGFEDDAPIGSIRLQVFSSGGAVYDKWVIHFTAQLE